MSINSFNLNQARENLTTMSLLTKAENKHSKLCFSPDGKDVALESSSGVFRTAKNLGNIAVSYFTKNITGWNRNLNSLSPLIEKTVAALDVELSQQEIIVIANEIRQAIEGLSLLAANNYQNVNEKAAIVEAAITTLEGAYDKFEVKSQAKNMLASMQLTESARKSFEHLEQGYSAQIEMLKKIIEEKDNEIARLKELLESKESENSGDSKSEEKEQELTLPSVFSQIESSLKDLKSGLNTDIAKLKNL